METDDSSEEVHHEVWCTRCGDKVDEFVPVVRTDTFGITEREVGACPNCCNTSFQFTETDGKLSYRLLRKFGVIG